MTEKPLYEHDCDMCIFLGVYKGKDLYWCNGDVVARYSSAPSGYSSGVIFQDRIECIKEAVLRARSRGHRINRCDYC